MKKVIICGYRDWADELYNFLNHKPKFSDKSFIYVSNNEVLMDTVKESKPEFIFFVGWSWIVSEDIIKKYKCICLHPSPLPKYRGGSPIQHQIINGEKESAVTLFEMDEGLDTGDILYQKSFSLDGDLKDIFNRIIEIGYEGIVNILEENYTVTKQNDKRSTFYNRRTEDMSEINIGDISNFTAEELHNKVRALQYPYPNAYIRCKDNTKLFITNTNLGENDETN
tara:strand:+ start:305 stop:979 length:675 start_codon:yes stop_codon:yes gene_type:complete